jgi:hypothetical protein
MVDEKSLFHQLETHLTVKLHRSENRKVRKSSPGPTNIPCSISQFWERQFLKPAAWVRFGSKKKPFQFLHRRSSIFGRRMEVYLTRDLISGSVPPKQPR